MDKEQEELQEFWEKCGVRPQIKIANVKYHSGMALDGSGDMEDVYPEITLDNLFRYALLPLLDKDIDACYTVITVWFQALRMYREDPAQALYQALRKVLCYG